MKDFYLTVPLMRKYVINNPEDSFVNTDLETIAKLCQGSNLAGLQGRKITTVIVAPIGETCTFRFEYENTGISSAQQPPVDMW